MSVCSLWLFLTLHPEHFSFIWWLFVFKGLIQFIIMSL